MFSLRKYPLAVLFLCTCCSSIQAFHYRIDPPSFELIQKEGFEELYLLKQSFQTKKTRTFQELQLVNERLLFPSSTAIRLSLLQQKLQLLDEMTFLEQQEELQTLQVRYRKGLDLIKLMYEKILGLDHHFSSLQTYQNIAVLSNPNTYPGFEQIRKNMKKRSSQKFGFDFPGIWDSNPFLTATFSLISTLTGKGKAEEKAAEIDDMSCILDFTLRMNADLGIVRHETEFLKMANQALKADCEQLFREYTHFLGYEVALQDCRKNDDWENLHERLFTYIEELKLKQGNAEEAATRKMQVDLAFATQRVADFITKYSNFIQRGIQYYRKFDGILSSYENEELCSSDLPRQFKELKEDVSHTIKKFNTTYNLPEIQGSRLKSLLYGSLN